MNDHPLPPATLVAGVAALFDQGASMYDTTGVAFFGPVADGLVEVLDPRPGQRILDLGCGRGAVLARVAATVAEAVGVDVSPAMVAQCRTSLAARANVRVEVGDASTPDAALGTFDAVTASLVLFFLPDPAAALRAWRDRLVVGGRCVISTFGPSGPAWRAIDEVFMPYLPAHMRDARTPALAATSPNSAVEALFAEAGFGDMRTVVRPLDTRLDSLEQWEAFSRSTGQRAMWLAVPEPELPTVRAAVADILLSAAHPDGGYVLSQTVRYTTGVNSGG